MRSSTSSSSPRLLLLAVAVFLAAAGALELGWRRLGYVPSVLDDVARWCVQRDRVYADGAVVLLGSSRMLYNVSIPALRDRFPGRQVAQLAIGGSLAGSVLRDLAEDPEFHGVVLASIDALGFERWHWNSQQEYIDHYREAWNPERKLDRRIRTALGSRLVLMNPSLDLRQLLRQPLDFGRWLPEGGLVFRPDRSIDSDFTRRSLEKYPGRLRRQFNRRRLVASKPAAWLDAARTVESWIEQIQARGGRVALIRFPTTGLVWKYDEKLYPRREYWDRFAVRTAAVTIHFMDVPALSGFDLPDDSHIDVRDKRAFTDALIGELATRGAFDAAARSASLVGSNAPRLCQTGLAAKWAERLEN